MKTVEEIIKYLEALENAYNEEFVDAVSDTPKTIRDYDVINEDYWVVRKILTFIEQED